VLLAAGDISTCGNDGDEQTARILDGQAGTIATLGDNAYEDGTSSQFANCYDPTWGRHKDRTRPSPGNHDYHTGGASGYYNYFGAAAGPSGRGYYSYDLGAWHIISLNSNVSMSPGSAQEQWLRNDLATNTASCTLAYWHHPRFSSSSTHGNHPGTGPLFQALYDDGADIVLVGHDHTYERFAPQSPNAQANPQFGIREFVVGTGGRSHYGFDNPEPNSEIRSTGVLGVLKLTLSPTGYTWQFLPVAGGSFSDSGSGSCHGAPGGTAVNDTVTQATLMMALPIQAAMLTRIPARIVRGKTRNQSPGRLGWIGQPFSSRAQRRREINPRGRHGGPAAGAPHA
jgi:acid phosphatase type 7